MNRLVGTAVASVTTVVLALAGTTAAVAGPSGPSQPRLVAPPMRALHSTPVPDGAPTASAPVRQLIVRTANGKRAGASITSSATAYSGGIKATAVRVLPSGMTVIRFAHPLSQGTARHVSALLTARSDVAWAQPDHHFVALGSSGVSVPDPYFDSQWDLWDSAFNSPNGGYSVRAPLAWRRQPGTNLELGKSSVVVAVLDTGITPHPELANAIFDTGQRDRGYVVPYGYDFITDPFIANDSDPSPTATNSRDANPLDDGDWVTAQDVADHGPTTDYGCSRVDTSSWHGTHVAGTIAAAQDSQGITGIAPGVKLEPIRVLGKCGGSESDIIDAIEWASGHTVPGVPDNAHKASVINMSLGGPGICSVALQTAIDDARAAGTTVVVAAGNDSTDITATDASSGSSPGDCTGVVSVSATGRGGELAQYSNFGTAPGAITIAAPGGDDFGVTGTDNILSTWWNSPDSLTNTTNGGADYAFMAGTSMATPHVAAVVALMQSHLTTPLTPSQVAQRLRETATPFPASSGCSVIHCGAGILNASAALATVPSAPDYINATQLPNNDIRLAWSRPSWGGSPILDYVVEQSTDGGSTWAAASDGTPAAQGLDMVATITGLSASTPYRFRVAAINQLNQGNPAGYLWSTLPTDITTQLSPDLPGQVGQPTVTGGVEKFSVKWDAPTSGAPPTSYIIDFHRRGTAGAWTSIAPAIPVTFRSWTYSPWPGAALPAGIYDVRVRALSDSTSGPASLGSSATVSILTQTGTVSADVLRPAKDGFQDSLTLRATSNAARAGTVRIRNSAGAVVMSWPLSTSPTWAATWSGRSSTGVRVPFGKYRIEFWRPVRSSAPALISSRSVSVLSSQAATPTVTLTSETVYPVRDGYLDTIPIRASAVVPSTYTLDILNKGAVVYHRTYSRRSLLTVSWNGTDDQVKVLPVGAYTLRITARGVEGTSTVKQRRVMVSSLRARPRPFSLQVTAGEAMLAYSSGVTVVDSGNGVQIDGGDDPTTPDMELNLATFNEMLPTSVMTPTSVTVQACTTHLDNSAQNMSYVGYFTGPADNPYLSKTWAYQIGDARGCYATKAHAPSFALVGGYVQFWVGNGNVTGHTWTVNSFRITGNTYYLAP